MLFQNTGLTRAMYQFFQTLIYVAPATLLAVSLHEFAHGYVSYKLGDMTPKYDGRLTLNPFKHLDVWGTLCLLVFHVGWAKPVRINTRNYKNKKRDTILVAAAGVVMNFLLAFVCMILHGLLYKYGSSGLILNYLYVLTYYGAVLNIGLGVFNLIPIPPLDGSNILAEIFPRVAEFYWKIRPYSMWISASVTWNRNSGCADQSAEFCSNQWNVEFCESNSESWICDDRWRNGDLGER